MYQDTIETVSGRMRSPIRQKNVRSTLREETSENIIQVESGSDKVMRTESADVSHQKISHFQQQSSSLPEVEC